MTDKERIRQLIDNPKKLTLSDWVYEVETFLQDTNNVTSESQSLIGGIKSQVDAFLRCENLTSLLKQIYKKQYDIIALPPITKRNQVFVAMMFSEVIDAIYENVYKSIIQEHNFSAMRIDQKIFTGSIINEITDEISNSVALIADLTGNRGGVYYEAGIARGLQLCNHPIKLIFTCNKEFFLQEKVHFDVSGDNIILYDNENDLKSKLSTAFSEFF